jgi:hypothetical protein
MNRIARVVVALGLSLSLCSVAGAQGLLGVMDGETRTEPRPIREAGPSATERAYMESLAQALGRAWQGAGARTAQLFVPSGDWTNTREENEPATARGVVMRYPDLEVRRMHFPSHAYAVAYAMNTLDLDATRGPVFTELRGKQIVVLRGAAVADTAGLPALVDAAFGVGLPQSLPVPAERGTTSALLLKDGTLAVTSEDANEAFAQSFQRAHDKANEKIGQGAPGFRDDGGKLNFSFPSGVNGYVLDASGTKTVVIAQDATQRATLDEFLAVTNPPGVATEGAFTGSTGVLNGLFD